MKQVILSTTFYCYNFLVYHLVLLILIVSYDALDMNSTWYYHSTTTNMLCLDSGKCIKLTSYFWWSKLKTSWSACAGIISEPTTADFWLGTCIHRTKGYDVLAWSRQHRCIDIGLIFSDLYLKYWLTNIRGTNWQTKQDRAYLQHEHSPDNYELASLYMIPPPNVDVAFNVIGR